MICHGQLQRLLSRHWQRIRQLASRLWPISRPVTHKLGGHMAGWPVPDVGRQEMAKHLESAVGAAENCFQPGQIINVRRPKVYTMDSDTLGRNFSAQIQSGTFSTMSGEACQSTSAAGCSSSTASPSQPSVRVSLDVAANSNFSEALRHAVNGGHIARAGWNGAGQYVFAQYPDKGSKMTDPYLVLRNTRGGFLPWAPSQGDVFARDWALLPGRSHDVS